MNCPKCKAPSRVTQTERVGHCIARKRKCQRCGHAFCTAEIITPAAQEMLSQAHKHESTLRRAKMRFERACKEAEQRRNEHDQDRRN